MAKATTPTASRSNTMWGGRFQASPAEIMEEINASVAFDQALAGQDIAGSKAHAQMLADGQIITQSDATAIIAGLDQILAEIARGEFVWRRDLEDVHMNVESRLKHLIGDAAGRLHTGRSRNDQVAVDFRMYVRDQVDGLDAGLHALQLGLARKAATYADTIMPGFTHLQPAQPVTFGHHLLAYVEMIARDRSRLADARRRLNECPLGAAALAGTPYPINREQTAKALGFDRPTANSLDSVADRDFALEVLAAASISAMHLSRLSEEIVIWMTPQFRFIQLSDKFTTGSSIMPQKRNPDAAELCRAKVGRIAGAFQSLLIVMKGLPLTYSKDMQEDKEVTFDALKSLNLAIAAMAGMVDDMVANKDAMRRAVDLGYITATDLADWLVRRLGLPFREAHHVTGRVVAAAEAKGVGLEALELAELQAIESRITADIYKVLSAEASVASRTSYGGTAPQQVAKMAATWIKRLDAGTEPG